MVWGVLAFLMVLGVLLRYGLLAAMMGLTANAFLQSAPFVGRPSHWSAPGTLLQVALVLGAGAWGLWLVRAHERSRAPAAGTAAPAVRGRAAVP